MSATLNVQFDYPKLNEPPASAYTLVVTVTNAVDMPDKIFVFYEGVYPGALTGTAEDSIGFVKVATPVDLASYPIDVADPINEMPYFRRNTVSLIFRDMTTLLETKTLIFNDINSLVHDMRTMDTIPTQERVTFDGSQSSIDIPGNGIALS
jgi:hypothetical protein